MTFLRIDFLLLLGGTSDSGAGHQVHDVGGAITILLRQYRD
jgi:hypothetical protein